MWLNLTITNFTASDDKWNLNAHGLNNNDIVFIKYATTLPENYIFNIPYLE